MEYNFSSISVDAITDFEKKMRKVKQQVLDDISNFIHVLNDQEIIDQRGEITTVISDIFNDTIAKCVISWTGCMNQVQLALTRYL